MGKFNHSLFSIFAGGLTFLASLCPSHSNVFAASNGGLNSVMQRLEAGEVVSTKAGSSVTVQSLIALDPAKAMAAFQDIKLLPEIFKDIDFVQVYTVEKKNIVYMKLKGLGDGVGVLAEVKQGSEKSFANATELLVSARNLGLRDTSSEVEIKDDLQQNQLIKELEIKNDDRKAESVRSLQIVQTLVLEGPLNTIEQMPTNRFTIALGVGPYSVLPPAVGERRMAPKVSTYVVSKVSVGNQVAFGEIFDLGGFGDRKLSMTMKVAEDLLRGLRVSLAGL